MPVQLRTNKTGETERSHATIDTQLRMLATRALIGRDSDSRRITPTDKGMRSMAEHEGALLYKNTWMEKLRRPWD